jgi:hypothetical protein
MDQILVVVGGADQATAYEEIGNGESIYLEEYLLEGRLNIVMLKSSHDDYGEDMKEELEELAAEDQYYAVVVVEIDRPGASAIDYSSPVAQQFGIDEVPYFLVYDGKYEVARGEEAANMVNAYLSVQ